MLKLLKEKVTVTLILYCLQIQKEKKVLQYTHIQNKSWQVVVSYSAANLMNMLYKLKLNSLKSDMMPFRLTYYLWTILTALSTPSTLSHSPLAQCVTEVFFMTRIIN